MDTSDIKLRYHIRFPKMPLHGHTHGHRSRERPKKWLDNIPEDCEDLNMSIIKHLVLLGTGMSGETLFCTAISQVSKSSHVFASKVNTACKVHPSVHRIPAKTGKGIKWKRYDGMWVRDGVVVRVVWRCEGHRNGET